jgi:ubiquinol-cytochrome c reductase cytochrome b subunit
VVRRLVRWLDDRLGTARVARAALNKAFPDHWSFMLGELALYCFMVLVITGIFLCFFYDPSAEKVTYHGHYAALHGVAMSQAYRSVVRLSFDVRAGIVMRQIHHWAALVFVAAIVAHLCRIFFTGAFRRPRELNWLVGVTLLVFALFNGFTGYSLPDDLLSGTGLRIAYSILLSIPVVGEWLAFLVFGGEFPANDIISRLFVIHVLLVPAAITALLSVHLLVLWRQKHTQFAGPGRTERNVVGSRLWPTYAAKSLGLFFLVAAALAALGGLAQINPIWLYGPFEPSAVTTAAQPDWYLGWLEGALRLTPPLPLHIFGHTVSEVFWPGILLPAVTFLALYSWPWIERFVTRDRAEHHLLDRPRDRPARTAIGVGVLTFYAVLVIAGAQDVFAEQTGATVATLNRVLQAAVVVAPIAAAALTYRWARDLRAADSEKERHATTAAPEARPAAGPEPSPG